MRFAPLLLLLATAPAMPASPFTIPETGQSFADLQEAVRAVGNRDATILIAPGVYRQCAVQEAGRITFRAVEPGKSIFDSELCEDKAALVLRGRGSAVQGLVFRGYHNSDGNGAGIRIETGDLTVQDAMFLDSQEGILGGQPTDQRIAIDHSSFAGLGQCDEAVNCSHAIYLSNQGSVAITRSRFERGTGGHYVKLRVPHVTIADNSFDDSAGHKTNYMIDLSEGATGLIARNVFVQGKGKENDTALIAVAAEARTYSSLGLTIVDNQATLAPGAPTNPAFVADRSRQALRVLNNQLGAGIRAFEQR